MESLLKMTLFIKMLLMNQLKHFVIIIKKFKRIQMKI